MAWLTNPSWRELDDIKIGDIVHIKNDDGLGSLLKGIVSKVEVNKIFAEIEASFGLGGTGEILNGLSLQYVNKELEFDKSLVQKVIAKR